MNKHEFERVKNNLLDLLSMQKNAMDRYNEAVQNAAELCEAKPAVIKKAISALHDDKAKQVAEDAEQLSMLLF